MTKPIVQSVTFKASPKELFALFSSPSRDEVEHVYSAGDSNHFEHEGLDEEYELTQEKREFSLDAWRSVLLFLHRHGYSILREDEPIDIYASSGLRP